MLHETVVLLLVVGTQQEESTGLEQTRPLVLQILPLLQQKAE